MSRRRAVDSQGMRFKMVGVALGLTVLLAGCTVGTDSSLDNPPSTTLTDTTTIGTTANPGTPASALAVAGTVVDGPITGATISFFADATGEFPITGVGAATDGFGKFQVTVPGASLTGMTLLFVKSHGGIDPDAPDGPDDMLGVLPATGTGVVAVTPASTLAVKVLATDRGATVDQARTQVKAMFGLDDTFVMDPTDVLVGSELQVMGRVLVNAGSRAHPEGATTAARTEATLNDLATGITNAAADVSSVSGALADMNSQGAGDIRLNVHAPPEFTVDGVWMGANRMDVSTMPVIVATDHLQEVDVPSVPASLGSTLPDVGLDFALHSDGAFPTHFLASIEVDVKGRAPDQRLLTLRFDGIKFTSPGAAAIEVNSGTVLTAGGTDASGAVVAAQTVTTLSTTATDVIGFVQTPSDRRLTLHSTAMLREIATVLGGLPATHPASLLDSTTPVDVSIVLRGFPTKTANGRLRRVVLPGVIRS